MVVCTMPMGWRDGHTTGQFLSATLHVGVFTYLRRMRCECRSATAYHLFQGMQHEIIMCRSARDLTKQVRNESVEIPSSNVANGEGGRPAGLFIRAIEAPHKDRH